MVEQLELEERLQHLEKLRWRRLEAVCLAGVQCQVLSVQFCSVFVSVCSVIFSSWIVNCVL